MLTKINLHIFFISFLFNYQIFAQSIINESCGAALNKDIISHIKTDRQMLSYLSQIDEKTYSFIKKDAGISTSIPLPFFGNVVELIKGSANYSEFNEKKNEYLKNIKYKSDIESETNDLQIVNSKLSYDAWIKCVDALTRDKKIISMIKEKEDSESVYVVIRNQTAVSVSLTTETLMNATVSGQEDGKAFKDGTILNAGGEIGLILKRKKDGYLKLSVNCDPAINALYIESIWGDADKIKLSGKLVQTSKQSNETITEKSKTGDILKTKNQHEKKCGDDYCYNENKIYLYAAPGAKLRNPSIKCNDSGCNWSSFKYKKYNSCVLEKNATVAKCNYRSGSHSHSAWVVAEEYKITESIITSAPTYTVMTNETQISIRVSKSSTGAIFEYNTPKGASSLVPGDKYSADRYLVLTGTSVAVDATYYTYSENIKQQLLP